MVNKEVRPGEIKPRTGPIHNRSKEAGDTCRRREKIRVEKRLGTRLNRITRMNTGTRLKLKALKFFLGRRERAEILPAIEAKTYTNPGRRNTSPEIKASNKRKGTRSRRLFGGVTVTREDW